MAFRTIMLALCLALAGCGQKGPLYFADEESPGDGGTENSRERDENERE